MKYQEKLKELQKERPKIDEKIKKMNKDVKKYNKLISEFYSNLYNYHNRKSKNTESIELSKRNDDYKKEVFTLNQIQEGVLKSINDQYQKDKAESLAKNKKTINYKGCYVIIRKGDLTEEREDAIVNLANQDLDHKREVAKAILQKGGEVIRKESEEIIKKHGSLPTGEAITTNAGDLPCLKVIHVVETIYSQNSMIDLKQEQELRSAIKNILREMNKYKMNSVSFPVISTGILKFSLQLSAVIIGEVLKEAIDNNPDFYQDKRLIICNPDEKTTNKMLEYIPNCLQEIGMVI